MRIMEKLNQPIHAGNQLASVMQPVQEPVSAIHLSNSQQCDSQYRTTVLEKVEYFLNNLDAIYQILIQNKFIKQLDKPIPTKEQLKQYFELLKKGFEYMEKEYGLEALPRNLVLYSNTLVAGDPDFICYNPTNDQIGISLLHIAKICCWYSKNTVSQESHLPIGWGVTAEDFTVLQAIEESYHRYQIKHLRMESADTRINRNHLLEKQIRPIFDKAINDLGIELIPI